jgi:hypothetical protein
MVISSLTFKNISMHIMWADLISSPLYPKHDPLDANIKLKPEVEYPSVVREDVTLVISAFKLIVGQKRRVARQGDKRRSVGHVLCPT